MSRILQKRGNRWRLVDSETGEVANWRKGELDAGGWDDWNEARLGKQEVELKVQRDESIRKGFVTRARERFGEAQMGRRKPDESDLRILQEAGQIDDAGQLVAESGE